MHSAIPVTKSVYWVGTNDRETDLFEGLWPLPRGVCYNSYLTTDYMVLLAELKGEKADIEDIEEGDEPEKEEKKPEKEEKKPKPPAEKPQ